MWTFFSRHGSNGSGPPPAWRWFRGGAALAFLVAVVAIATAGGCQSAPEPKVDDESVMAEKAKAALVALARAKPSVLERDPDRLEGMPLVKGDEPHVYRLAWIMINVEERWYDFCTDRPYFGRFTVDADGRWTAQDPVNDSLY